MFSTLGFIGLGSNLGDRRAQIKRALESLVEHSVKVEQVSSLYQTEPVDMPVQPWFLNAVAKVYWPYMPHELLGICQSIESQQGRQRGERFSSRTIDLDLLMIGDHQLETPDLTLPHPRLCFRRFVLTPFAEIAPQSVHPQSGLRVVEILDKCADPSTVIRVSPAPFP